MGKDKSWAMAGTVLFVLSTECLAFAAQAAAPAAAPAHGTAQDVQAQSAQVFVQGFYDWYTGAVQKDDNHADDEALAGKRWPMGAAIVAALKADEDAQAKSPDDIVGIDFDPYLNAQDTCFPYKTGKVTQAGGLYRVEVFDSNCDDPHPERPTVIAVVQRRGASWEFVNFIYPGDAGQAGSDLLSVLKALKDDREKNPDQ